MQKKEIGTMGLIGRGPKEFITPLSISSIGNKIFTYDLNQNKQAYYSHKYPIMNSFTSILKKINHFNGFIQILLSHLSEIVR